MTPFSETLETIPTVVLAHNELDRGKSTVAGLHHGFAPEKAGWLASLPRRAPAISGDPGIRTLKNSLTKWVASV
jgi:hypothetical protein